MWDQREKFAPEMRAALGECLAIIRAWHVKCFQCSQVGNSYTESFSLLLGHQQGHVFAMKPLMLSE